jgi:hypothetical protein
MRVNRAAGEPFRPPVAGVRTVTDLNRHAAPKAGMPVRFLLFTAHNEIYAP